jgi:ABC-2 type transport system ATP-binding protein
MPEDAHPDQPDGGRGGARAPLSPVRPLPPKPETPAEFAARESAPAAPRAKPAAKRPSKKSPRKKAAPDPGPPPPLPPDLVIPPKPPLPAAEPAPAAETDPVFVAGPHSAPEPVSPEQPAVIAEPDPADEPEAVLVTAPEPVSVAEPESASSPVLGTGPGTATAPPIDLPVEPAPPPAAAHRRRSEGADESPAGAGTLPEVFVAASVDPDTAALVVKGVTKAFGETRAVDGIDLTVPAGIFYGLVGPNGAGKTTTLSMIAGLLRPDRGAIRVNGVDAISHPLDAKRQMGVLPDRLRTFDRLTGRQLLHYYGVLRGLPSAVVESRTNDLARAFDLSDALGRAVSDYSAGMVKKVMLAGAMIHSPRLLVLDEPFEAVDPVSSAIILDILKTYVAHGGTVILSSHGMDLVERVCTRVAVIVAGQVLAEGTVDEVRGELTLEQRFIELAGGLSDVEGLEWLHTFSD